jgi:hemerythrin-like domain-containing protein
MTMNGGSGRTASLRRQHDAAITLVLKIEDEVGGWGAVPSRAQAYAATLLLAKLTGLLRIHFAQEDRLLYPSLIASARGGVATVARQFFEEMGQIGPLFDAFAERWRSADAILGDAAGFRREAKALFAALAKRVQRENEILYPLADAQMDDGLDRVA